jgi:hypothetical protein
MFEANSTASARLIKITYIKLYNRLMVRRGIDAMFKSFAESGM